jgi:CO dehydrogenase nickel-insertion accessory protein CooC1
VKKITERVGIKYEHLYIVGNHEFDKESEQMFTVTGETYLGKMAFDKRVREYNLKGKSLWELPIDSPACDSVKQILDMAELL